LNNTGSNRVLGQPKSTFIVDYFHFSSNHF